MSIKPIFAGKAEFALKAEAEKRGVTATALAMAIIVTVVQDGIVDAVLEDIDITQFQNRRRGRPYFHAPRTTPPN